MDDVVSLIRLLASGAVAAAIILGLYRGLRWKFPRLGKWRARLIVGLGTVFLASGSASLLTTGGAQCVQHENIVILRADRVLQIRKEETRAPKPMIPQRYAQVVQSCEFLVAHCPLENADATRLEAENICLKAFAGQPIQ